MLDFADLESKRIFIPEAVKKLYHPLLPGDHPESVTSKSGLTLENSKNSLRFMTDVETIVRSSRRVPPPSGGYKALRLLQSVVPDDEKKSTLGYAMSHNKRKIVLLAVGVTVGAITGGLGLVVLAGSALVTYGAGVAWRNYSHVLLRRKGNMNFDPNSAEDFAKIEEHVETWQDRIVKRQFDGMLQKMHFQQQCWTAMQNTGLFSSGPNPYSSCAQWVQALETLSRLRVVTEEVHVGVKDLVHFWGLMTFEMVDRNQKFGAKLPTILGIIEGQITKRGHRCVYGDTWFGDGNTSRSISGGVCYEWKDARHLVHPGGPIYPKHTINESVPWERRLYTSRASLFMKLLQDASTWGALIDASFTGGNSTLPGRFQTRLRRSVDMFSGGKPDRAEDIKNLYPMLFSNSGGDWMLQGGAMRAPTPPPPSPTSAAPSTTPGAMTGEDHALGALATTGIGAATQGAGRAAGGLATGIVSGHNIGESIASSFNPSAAAAPTNLFSNAVGSGASNAVSSGAGYATAGLAVILEVINTAENASIVTRGQDLFGNVATVSELITAHAGVLKDHFGAISWAWKGFRKADNELMALGSVPNCTEAFKAAANLLRREMYFRELARLYHTLHTFVCLVGSTHGGIVQMLEDETPETVDKLNRFLAGHTSPGSGSGTVEEVCQGYCYRPMTAALATLHKVTAVESVIGTPVRPIASVSTTTINK